MKRRRTWLSASALLLLVACLYAALGLVNLRAPTLRCEGGVLRVPQDEDVRFSLLAGEWLRYPGAPEPEALPGLAGTPVDVLRVGVMEGNTFRVTLSGGAPGGLFFMLPRPRGSRLYIDGREVLPAGGGAISSRDVFALADWLDPAREAHDLVLRIPVSGYLYSGYQGVALGERGILLAVGRLEDLTDTLCLGLYVALALIGLVLFLQKPSETYILYLVLFTVVTAYRFMSFSERFALYPVFRGSSQFYRVFFFLRYLLCRAFVYGNRAERRLVTDRVVLALCAVSVLALVLAPERFSSLSVWLSYAALIIEGAMIAKGLAAGKEGAHILLAGWAIYTGREVFYTLLHMGAIPQGVVDVVVRPAQYAYLCYLLAFAAAILGKFARKFSEAEEMALSLEQKVQEQTQELREKNRDILREQARRQQFMTDIVHNLRNPLFALGGYIELLESRIDSPSEEQQKYLRLIDDKLLYINRMVDDMLLADRLENRKIEFHFVRLELCAFLRDVILGNKRLEQCGQVHIDCPEVYLEADGFRLHQALDNLLDNAVLHGGCTCLDVTGERRGDSVLITLRDNGKGMSPEQLAHAFDRYYTSGQKNSTGLGLPIAAAIIGEHGGTISLDSAPGGGTTVRIALPAERNAGNASAEEA